MTTRLNRWEACRWVGGRQSRWGTESAAMSAQTERGESLPEEEPGQTRAEDRALVPNTRDQGQRVSQGDRGGRRSKMRGGQGADHRAWQQRPRVTWDEQRLRGQWR